MQVNTNTLRSWLIQNDYLDVAELIDGIISEWKTKGNKQRRNWWDILAGDKNGNSRIIAGRTIPVLKAAQVRKKVNISVNALCKDEKETPPVAIKEKHRWSKNSS